MVTHTCYPSTREMEEVEAGGSDIQGYPWLYSEYKTSLGYTHVHPLFKKAENKKSITFS